MVHASEDGRFVYLGAAGRGYQKFPTSQFLREEIEKTNLKY